jgi:hypothetical protein
MHFEVGIIETSHLGWVRCVHVLITSMTRLKARYGDHREQCAVGGTAFDSGIEDQIDRPT